MINGALSLPANTDDNLTPLVEVPGIAQIIPTDCEANASSSLYTVRNLLPAPASIIAFRGGDASMGPAGLFAAGGQSTGNDLGQVDTVTVLVGAPGDPSRVATIRVGVVKQFAPESCVFTAQAIVAP